MIFYFIRPQNVVQRPTYIDEIKNTVSESGNIDIDYNTIDHDLPTSSQDLFLRQFKLFSRDIHHYHLPCGEENQLQPGQNQQAVRRSPGKKKIYEVIRFLEKVISCLFINGTEYFLAKKCYYISSYPISITISQNLTCGFNSIQFFLAINVYIFFAYYK